MRNRSRLLLALGGLSLLVAACGGGGDAPKGATVKATPVAPAKLAVTASAAGDKVSFEVGGPVPPGATEITLTNNLEEQADFQLFRLDEGHTLAEVIPILSDDTPVPAWMKVAGGVGTTAPGGTGVALVELQAGRYDFIATGGGNGQPLFARGAQGSFEVSGTASGAKLPATPAQIRTVERSPSDYGFETSGLKAGTNRVTFTNTGAQLHHVVVAKLQPGATFEKAKEFLASDEPPPGQPPVDFDNAVGSAVLDSGGKEVMTLDLESGSYVFVCFLSDRTGSQPHAIKAGMINEVQVP